jgi:hypothetical protein
VNALQIPGLVSFWDFQEPTGETHIAKGPVGARLTAMAGEMDRVSPGVFDPHALRLREGQWLRVPRQECGALNICGAAAQVSVVAWLQRHRQSGDHCEAVAGIWNESRRQRQYCLFMNLHIWDSHHQVCGHVSNVGGPTPGYRYCMDASIGATAVPFDEWVCVGFTYDGQQARSYMNGHFDERAGRNPYAYGGGLFAGGDDGADFTVGAVDRSNEMGNWFAGVLGGLAVFQRALTGEEMQSLARWSKRQ